MRRAWSWEKLVCLYSAKGLIVGYLLRQTIFCDVLVLNYPQQVTDPVVTGVVLGTCAAIGAILGLMGGYSPE
jgi:hypothetical protein